MDRMPPRHTHLWQNLENSILDTDSRQRPRPLHRLEPRPYRSEHTAIDDGLPQRGTDKSAHSARSARHVGGADSPLTFSASTSPPPASPAWQSLACRRRCSPCPWTPRRACVRVISRRCHRSRSPRAEARSATRNTVSKRRGLGWRSDLQRGCW